MDLLAKADLGVKGGRAPHRVTGGARTVLLEPLVQTGLLEWMAPMDYPGPGHR